MIYVGFGGEDNGCPNCPAPTFRSGVMSGARRGCWRRGAAGTVGGMRGAPALRDGAAAGGAAKGAAGGLLPPRHLLGAGGTAVRKNKTNKQANKPRPPKSMNGSMPALRKEVPSICSGRREEKKHLPKPKPLLPGETGFMDAVPRF